MSKTVTIDPDVREILVRATITADSVELPVGQLERSLYVRVDKVLAAAGGKWDRKTRTHRFSGFDPRVLLGDVATVPKIVHRQQTLQAFYTPPPQAAEICELADVQAHHECLEPSAGQGAIADAMRACGVEQPTLVELDQQAVAILLSKGYKRVYFGDFLTGASRFQSVPRPFDRIVMNPPFTKGQDVAHVTRAFGLLRTDGVLVSIMSPSFTFRTTKVYRAFRDLLNEHGEIVTRYPAGTFEDTTIETVVVRLFN